MNELEIQQKILNLIVELAYNFGLVQLFKKYVCSVFADIIVVKIEVYQC